MKRNLLSLLVAGAFCSRLFAVEEGVASDHKPFEIDLTKVKSWAQEGEKAGNRVREVTDEAESFVVNMLLATAEVIAGTPSQEDWLTGYAKAWKNPDTAKSRKGDARAVMEAYGLKDEEGKLIEVERTVGVVQEDAPDGSAKKGELVKETKLPRQWLREYQGDFRGFLALARDLRGKKSAGGAGQSGRSRKVMTDTQHKGVLEMLPVANSAQAAQIIEKATGQLARAQNFERHLVTEMQMICNVIKQRSNDKAYLEFAMTMLDTIDAFISKREVADAEQIAKAGGQKAESKFDAPAPAEQQKKAA